MTIELIPLILLNTSSNVPGFLVKSVVILIHLVLGKADGGACCSSIFGGLFNDESPARLAICFQLNLIITKKNLFVRSLFDKIIQSDNI